MLRLLGERGSIDFVDWPDDVEPPETVLVQRPNHYIIGERYELQSRPLRNYRWVRNEALPPR